ncbi:MAG: hypothetical protein ACI91B_000291 [Planctomycetota bacterium]|jgi:hypothetical protein
MLTSNSNQAEATEVTPSRSAAASLQAVASFALLVLIGGIVLGYCAGALVGHAEYPRRARTFV